MAGKPDPPDKLIITFWLVGGIILFAAAFQSVDNPVSGQGIAVGVGALGVFFLAIWRTYSSKFSVLSAPDIWLGTGLLVIMGIITGAVV